MSAVQRAAAAAVAVLVVAILAVVLLSAGNGPISRRADPAGSADATPSPSPSAATEEPTGTAIASPASPGEEDVLAILDEIEEQVIAIRGLPAADIGPADVISRAELEVELRELFDAEYPPEDRERDNVTLRAFGLLTPQEDIGELQLELLTEQVVGFYDDTEQRMVVVSETGLDANAKLTYAHEYTHALQDAAFGLDSLETDAEGEDDRSLARTALVEGDATITMLAWALQHLSQQELSEIGSGPVPDTADVPGWMLNQLLFPYVAGQEWILAMMADSGGTPFAPDFTPVDAAFGDPPDSTAQILEPAKWFERVAPVEVELPDLAAALGGDWEEVSSSSVGQATAGIILEHFGVSDVVAGDATAGWAGDRAVVVRGPGEAFSMVWRSAWESEADATAFETAYGAVVDALPFPAAVTRHGEIVLVVHASDADVLRRTVEATR